MRRTITVLALLLASLPACSPAPAGSTGEAATTRSSDETLGASATSNDVPTETAATGTPATSDAASGTSGGPDPTGGTPFIAKPDAEPAACDLEEQNCPAGQKCNPSSIGCGSITCGEPICVPVVRDPQPPGAPCSVLGDGEDGTDDCELGSVCLFFHEEGVGHCRALCNVETHRPIDTTCPPDTVCLPIACQSCFWSYCEAPCDPRDPGTCEAGQACVVAPDATKCVLDSSGDEGEAGDPCTFLNSCDPGLHCAGAMYVAGCTSNDGCCSPYCSTDQPNTCPGEAQGEQCLPLFEEGMAPSGLDTLGLCALPP